VGTLHALNESVQLSSQRIETLAQIKVEGLVGQRTGLEERFEMNFGSFSMVILCTPTVSSRANCQISSLL
jgi:hypothetical protein